MYSKYPTKVNKYECHKGPFEGFFVSSVEFAKMSNLVMIGKTYRVVILEVETCNGVGTEQCGEEIEAAFQQFLNPIS